MWAVSTVVPQRALVEEAIESLDDGSGRRANALETLEAGGGPLVRPLLGSWEPVVARSTDDDWLAAALADPDPFIHRCADLVRTRYEGGSMPGSTMTLSHIERVLFLRKVPLFADLSPADLERVAAIAEELGYADGEVVAAEGELGRELQIVVEGTLRVIRDRDGSDHELALRTAGEVVGEMSLVTRSPRIASLVASGDVRTLRIGHREFESMLRERPSIALGVMRVLAERIAEGSRHRAASGG